MNLQDKNGPAERPETAQSISSEAVSREKVVLRRDVEKIMNGLLDRKMKI